MTLLWLRFVLLASLTTAVATGAGTKDTPAATGQAGSSFAATVGKPDPATAETGKKLFAQNCSACHSLAQDGIGPPLGGVTRLFTGPELLDRVRDPATVIASGNPRAKALSRRYKVVMPPQPQLGAEDIKAIFEYIADQTDQLALRPFSVAEDGASTGPAPRCAPPIQPSGIAVELEDVVQIPRLPNRTAYKGLTLLRPDPREAGALLVDDLMGLLYRVKNGRASVFLDVRGIFPDFICDPGVATGLGSFALHPDFPRNGIFYTTHAETYRGRLSINPQDIPADVPPSTSPRLEWVLTEWHLKDPRSAVFDGTHREVLRFVSPTTAHASQEIAFSPAPDATDLDFAKLYISIGDGGSINLKRPDMAGHPRTLLSTILRIDPAGKDGVNGQYGIPADNPFAQNSDPAIRREIWAYGFRNPHRFSWDTAHGRRMIAVDIGESNVEEVNLIERGGAYGWGVGRLEGTMHLDPTIDAKVVRPATAAELAPYHSPHGTYDHQDGSAITGGYVYHGPLAALRDKYIFGDIVSGRLFYMNFGPRLDDHTIYSLDIRRDGKPTSIRDLSHVERAHLRLGYDDRTGDLYILTKEDGMIRRVSAAEKE